MTEQQKDFVQMYLKHRDKIIAHNLAYGNNPNYDSVESSANRLLRIPEIAETIHSIQDNIRHEVEEEFKAKYREELMSIYDKRMLLKRIATGELYVEQKYKGKNCTQCSQYISPTINQMLAAIREDNKLAGHHPFKQNGKWIIPAQQTEQEENTKKENKRQQLNETIIDNQPLTVGQENTTEIPLLFLGGDIGASASGGDKRQSGWLTPDEQQTDETPEKDPSERIFIPAGNKRQQITETTIENQPLTENNTDSISLPGACPAELREGIGGQTTLETSVNSSGQIISKEKLDEILYPNRKIRVLDTNHEQHPATMKKHREVT